MDESPLTRRRLLGAAGMALSTAVAGCSLNAPGQATAEEGGEFPEERSEERRVGKECRL